MIPRQGFDSPLPKGQDFLEWVVNVATLAHLPFFRKQHHRGMGGLVAQLMPTGEEVYPIACGGRASR